jgi:hypothetical protein
LGRALVTFFRWTPSIESSGEYLAEPGLPQENAEDHGQQRRDNVAFDGGRGGPDEEEDGEG